MKYHNITKDDMLNGDGLRVVLWVSGCDHHCKDCQNPITWNPDDGLDFDESTKEELYTELEKDYISGITFSGGDPLNIRNRDAITELAACVREKFPNKTIWCYTGFSWDQVKDLDVMKYIDVLVDGEFVSELKDNTLLWKGSANQKVIDVQKTLESGSIVLHCPDRENEPINVKPCKGCGD